MARSVGAGPSCVACRLLIGRHTAVDRSTPEGSVKLTLGLGTAWNEHGVGVSANIGGFGKNTKVR
jgi:hypothetical protein